MAWTNETKNSATFAQNINYLLQQIGDYLLQEDDSKIVLQRSPGHKTTGSWTNSSKS